MSTAPCPLGICDGSGWIDDEDARAVRACACRPQLIASRRAHALSAVVPRRYRGVSFDRPPVSEMPRPQVDVAQPMFLQLLAQQGEGEPRPEHGNVGSAAQQVGNGADMVLVTMSEHQGLNVVEAILD